MTPFHRLMLSLWDENWRPELKALLARHGHKYSRYTVWRWQVGKGPPIPEPVKVIVNGEAKKKGKEEKISTH
jgi:hypothetical protein